MKEDTYTKCPICKRDFGDNTEDHHLIPKSLGGKVTVPLHQVCHSKIHHTFSERELEKVYNTIESLKEHEEIIKFVKWIGKKAPDFRVRNRDTKERNKKR